MRLFLSGSPCPLSSFRNQGGTRQSRPSTRDRCCRHPVSPRPVLGREFLSDQTKESRSVCYF